VHAILGATINALGEPEAAALEVQHHLDLVTTVLVPRHRSQPARRGASTSCRLPVTRR
jgi:hypothetical protein